MARRIDGKAIIYIFFLFAGIGLGLLFGEKAIKRFLPEQLKSFLLPSGSIERDTSDNAAVTAIPSITPDRRSTRLLGRFVPLDWWLGRAVVACGRPGATVGRCTQTGRSAGRWSCSGAAGEGTRR